MILLANTWIGGAQGIGAAAVALFHSFGAHVYFGDWDDVKGKQVEQDLQSKGPGGSVRFQRLDVRDYSSQLALFDAAFHDHGRVDVAVSCAAVAETPGWFEPENLDLESVRRVSRRRITLLTRQNNILQCYEELTIVCMTGTNPPERADRHQPRERPLILQDRTCIPECQQARGGQGPVVEIDSPALFCRGHRGSIGPVCLLDLEAWRDRAHEGASAVGAFEIRREGQRALPLGYGHSAPEREGRLGGGEDAAEHGAGCGEDYLAVLG